MRAWRSSPLVRGVLLGLSAGLFLGGLALLAEGGWALFHGPDCALLSPKECALEREIAVSLGRRQVLFGGGLALLGLSLYALRRSLPSPHPNP